MLFGGGALRGRVPLRRLVRRVKSRHHPRVPDVREQPRGWLVESELSRGRGRQAPEVGADRLDDLRVIRRTFAAEPGRIAA